MLFSITRMWLDIVEFTGLLFFIVVFGLLNY